jgi:hypothetical protein
MLQSIPPKNHLKLLESRYCTDNAAPPLLDLRVQMGRPAASRRPPGPPGRQPPTTWAARPPAADHLGRENFSSGRNFLMSADTSADIYRIDHLT